MKKPGQPAFWENPQLSVADADLGPAAPITLRDLFAAAAMSRLADCRLHGVQPLGVAVASYELADAMLLARCGREK